MDEDAGDDNWEVDRSTVPELDLSPRLATALEAKSPEDRQTLTDFIITRRAEVALEQAARRAERCQPPDFIDCKKREGPRVGMAFKLGDEGLGYYRDGIPVNISVQLEARPMYGTPPVTLAIDDLIPAAPGLPDLGSYPPPDASHGPEPESQEAEEESEHPHRP